MTTEQKNQLVALRQQGTTYVEISEMLNVPASTLKSYCYRKKLTEKRTNSRFFCQYCGKRITQTPGKKRRKFCSDSCRNAWWNSHPELVNRKAEYAFNCAHCGIQFTAYGNNHRKYCSHACYISDRYKKAGQSNV